MQKSRNVRFFSRILEAFALLGVSLLLQGCKHGAGKGSNGNGASVEELQTSVLGTWEESRGTREMLQFNADDTVQMDSPREHHLCKYDFPDAQHLRLNCAPPGAADMSQVWKVELTADKLMISDNHEMGTYKRK